MLLAPICMAVRIFPQATGADFLAIVLRAVMWCAATLIEMSRGDDLDWQVRRRLSASITKWS